MTTKNLVLCLLSLVWLIGAAPYSRGIEKDPGPISAERYFLKDEPDADGMFTALFYVPPNFIGGGKPISDYLRNTTTSKEILEKNGIKFGPNATAVFFPVSGILVVHNIKEELEKCAIFVDEYGARARRILRKRWRVVEVTEATWLDLTASQPDKLPRSLSTDDIKKLKSDSAWKSCALLECEGLSGHRFSIESGSEMQLVTGFKTEGEHLIPEIEIEMTGLVIETEAVLDISHKFADVNFSIKFDYSPPDVTKMPVASKTKEKMQQSVDLVTWHRDRIQAAITTNCGDTVVVGLCPVRADPSAKQAAEPRVRLYLLTVTCHFIR